MNNTLITTSLTEVCEVVTDGTHDSPKLQESGIPFIKGKHISAGRIDFDNCDFITEEDHRKCIKRVKPRLDDVLFSNIGSVGDAARVTKEIEFSIKNVALFRPNPQRIDPLYFYYLVISPYFRGHFLNVRSGSAQPFISLENFRSLKFNCLKDKVAQKYVGYTLFAYDDLIEKNRRRIHLLEQAARLLYKEWFIHLRFPGYEHAKIIDGVPEGWGKKPLGDVAPLCYGKALNKDRRTPGPFPVYGSSGIIGSHVKSFVSGPTIIVGRKGNVGSVFWSSDDCHPIDTVYYIETTNCSLHLYYALQHMSFISTDVAVPGLNRDFAHSRFVLVPEWKLYQLFDSKVRPLHQQIDVLRKTNSVLWKARDLLLPHLMNGEIAV